jgi:hypothetical protein
MVAIKKGLSVCFTLAPTKLQADFCSAIKLDMVYSKPYNNGTLYLLVHNNPRYIHGRLDSVVEKMNSTLGGNVFGKMSEFNRGWVKVFEKKDMFHDATYGEFFNCTICTKGSGRRHALLPDVHVWNPSDLDAPERFANISKDLPDDVLELKRRIVELTDLNSNQTKKIRELEARSSEKDQEISELRGMNIRIKRQYDEKITKASDNEDHQIKMATLSWIPAITKLKNLSKLVSMSEKKEETYTELWVRLARFVHPDKRICTPEQDGMFGKVCVRLMEMPKSLRN